MIIVTGAAGFIGSNLVIKLNQILEDDIIVVDDINDPLKKQNINNLRYNELVGINDFWDWILENKNKKIDTVIHLGACSDTLEKNTKFLYLNNVVYSQKLWHFAIEKKCKFIYASSAATYGDGSQGFSDDHNLVSQLHPLNDYGQSKQDFDLWVLDQTTAPRLWAGLKYFNVYGPGEAHKGRMASVVWHFIQQLKWERNIKLFDASHGFEAGEQKRDFIYIDDAVSMTIYIMLKDIKSGIYNIGTGTAQTFNDLAAVFIDNKLTDSVQFIPFPNDLNSNYQAYTCADMIKLKSAGYNEEPISLKKGIESYLSANTKVVNN